MASTCYVMPPEGMILITDKLLKMIGMHRGWKRVTGNILKFIANVGAILI
jgi:hypothetical protein